MTASAAAVPGAINTGCKYAAHLSWVQASPAGTLPVSLATAATHAAPDNLKTSPQANWNAPAERNNPAS